MLGACFWNRRASQTVVGHRETLRCGLPEAARPTCGRLCRRSAHLFSRLLRLGRWSPALGERVWRVPWVPIRRRRMSPDLIDRERRPVNGSARKVRAPVPSIPPGRRATESQLSPDCETKPRPAHRRRGCTGPSGAAPRPTSCARAVSPGSALELLPLRQGLLTRPPSRGWAGRTMKATFARGEDDGVVSIRRRICETNPSPCVLRQRRASSLVALCPLDSLRVLDVSNGCQHRRCQLRPARQTATVHSESEGRAITERVT